MRLRSLLCSVLLFSALSAFSAEDRNTKVIQDKSAVQEGGFWIYDDLPKARELARASGKPMLVVLRCIP